MTRTTLAFLACVTLAPAPLRADTSARPPQTDSVPESVLSNMMTVLASAAEEDAASPVKAPRGIRNFQGSNTLVRAALSYGILRTGGFGVAQAWAKEAENIGSALAFFDATNQKNLEASFKTLFGQSLVKARSGSGDDTRFSYNPAALEAAFTKLYVAPSTTVGGVRARVVYDTLFKSYVAQKAQAVAVVLSQKGFLASAAKDFTAQAANPKFEGAAWQDALASKLPAPAKENPRLVGTLVRRHADRSLPVVIKILRRILTDYDPKTLESLDARLRAPSA
jgi:hypothetical protein